MARKDANPGKKEVAAERRVRVLQLRQTGMGYREIAAKVGVALGTVYDDVQRSLDELAALEKDAAEQERSLQRLRLDRWLEKLNALIEKGDTASIPTALKVEERRSRLLGLDRGKDEEGGGATSPLKVYVNIDLGQV